MKPVYLLQGQEEVARIVADTLNRLHRCLQAARIVRPFVAEALGEQPALPEGIARLPLNQVVPWVLDAEGERGLDAHKFEEAVVRRAYPVLYLALALAHALHERERAAGRPASLEALMLNDEACALILERAEALEPILLRVKKFRVDPGR